MASKRALHRSIDERWVVKGTLVLLSPAHFGNGDFNPWMDLSLLVDETSYQPLLMGTSIAGALRNYMCERMLGFEEKETGILLASELFGSVRGTVESEQSPLIVFDSIGKIFDIELRDGIAIDTDTRAAVSERKHGLQLLAAGSEFPLHFELIVQHDGSRLLEALATALNGLEKDEITLGARKRRGFGKVTVKNWQVWKYDLHKKGDLLAWLASERDWQPAKPERKGESLIEKLGVSLSNHDQRELAHLVATFTIDGTLIIGSGFGNADTGPDIVHMHALRVSQKSVPIIPGTSWAGILRHRALKIARTISGNNKSKSQTFVDAMFGASKVDYGKKNTKSSRVNIHESEIMGASSLVINHVKIDRFTGGSFESSLVSEQPAVSTPNTQVTLDLTLHNPRQAELGLLLLLLKDLWTGNLPVGGKSGVGRGRLKGIRSTLTTPQGKWEFLAEGEEIRILPSTERLEEYVNAFNSEFKGI